jgi:hypothetical protein
MLKEGSSNEYIFPQPAWSPIGGSEAQLHGVSNNLFDRWLDMRIDTQEAEESDSLWKTWERSGSIYGTVLSMEEFEKVVEHLDSLKAREQQDASSEKARNGIHRPIAEVPLAKQLPDDDRSLKAMVTSEKVADNITRPGVLASLPRKQLVWTVLVSLGINFALPFVNGVMLGRSSSHQPFTYSRA